MWLKTQSVIGRCYASLLLETDASSGAPAETGGVKKVLHQPLADDTPKPVASSETPRVYVRNELESNVSSYS